MFDSTVFLVKSTDFCFHRAKLSERGVQEPLLKTCVCRQPVTVERSLTHIFRINRSDIDARRDTTIRRVPVCLQPPRRLPFNKFDSRTLESRASAAVSYLQISCAEYRCTLHMYRKELLVARSGRGETAVNQTVTKAINRKHKPRTEKTTGREPSSVEETKEKQSPSEGVACRRQPQSV